MKQFSVLRKSAGVLVDSNFNPSCRWIAVNRSRVLVLSAVAAVYDRRRCLQLAVLSAVIDRRYSYLPEHLPPGQRLFSWQTYSNSPSFSHSGFARISNSCDHGFVKTLGSS